MGHGCGGVLSESSTIVLDIGAARIEAVPSPLTEPFWAATRDKRLLAGDGAQQVTTCCAGSQGGVVEIRARRTAPIERDRQDLGVGERAP